MSNIGIIVDIETTGLDLGVDQIIEIAAIEVDLDNGKVLREFQTFSMPDEVYIFDGTEDIDDDIEPEPFELDPFIKELTGITEEMLEGAPSNSDATEAFFVFTKDQPIWAYNAKFDSRFLNKNTINHIAFHDVLALARRCFPSLPNHKLSTVAEHLNVSTKGTHRALADCLITKEVLMNCLKIFSEHPELKQHDFKATDYKPIDSGLFFGKSIVFTGALVAMTRDVAAQHASKYGFKIGSTVTSKTHYLVVGVQDLSHLAGHDKSTKHRKAEELIAEGIQINIITENDFLKIIQE
jgi:DNA polymerase-3 subunit epsilon